MVAAHACVSSRPVFGLLDRLASLPNPDRPAQAVLLVGVFALVTGYINWALSLVAGALFVPFVCRRNPQTDLRVLVAAAYLGLGTVWHGGLSGSAPLILATPGNPLLEPASGAAVVDRLIPVDETLFNAWNLIYITVVGLVGLAVVTAIHPRRGRVLLTPEQAEAILPLPPALPQHEDTPAGRMDALPVWVWFAALLLAYPLIHQVVQKGFASSWNIDAYNTVFLASALLLHGRARSFLSACREGIGSAWGIVLQFPFYAGIFGLMQNTGLGEWVGELFTDFSTQQTYPLLVWVYSGLMNLFVPSAGSKWLIEAPYLIPAGEAHGVSVVTTTLAYAYGDTATNMIQPFFAIPLLAVARLRFGDIVGYCFLVSLACGVVGATAMWLIPPDL
jgi:short-chain fatty acids transporter